MSGTKHIPEFDIAQYPDHNIFNDKAALQLFEDVCGAGGRLHLVAITPAAPKNTVETIRAFDFPKERATVKVFLGIQNTAGRNNLYFAPNISYLADHTMPDDASITKLRALVIDIDPLDTTGEDAWNAERLRIKGLVHDAIHHPQLSPSLVINTGNGAQLVYLLHPIAAGKDSNTLFRTTMKALAYHFNGDQKTTHKVSGLFRIAGTRNLPDPSKLQRGRHLAYGGIWHRDPTKRYELAELHRMAIVGAPDSPEQQPDDWFTPERLGLTMEQLTGAAHDLSDTLRYRVQAKESGSNDFARLMDQLRHPSKSSDRSADDFRFVATLITDEFTPAETAMCLGHFGASKAAPIGGQRWVTYVIRTVINARDRVGKIEEEFFVDPEEEPPIDETSTPDDKTKTKKRNWHTFNELAALQLRTGDALIEELIPRRGLSMLYGESNSGKSLLALLMCSCVASGTPFAGHAVNSTGLVVFVAMEGGGGLDKRIKALAKQYPDRDHSRLVCINGQYSLHGSDQGAKSLASELTDIRNHHDGQHIDLIVVDMLAVAASGANENSAEDMSKVLDRIERFEEHYGCHIMLLHHTGKNVARGARGWSGIRGRVDTEMEILSPKDLTFKGGFLRVSKQRDMDFNPSSQTGFMIRSIIIGTDDKGRPRIGATVELMSATDRGSILTEAEQGILDAILELGKPVTSAEISKLIEKSQNACNLLLKSMTRKRQLYSDGGKPPHYSPMWGFETDMSPDNGSNDPFA